MAVRVATKEDAAWLSEYMEKTHNAVHGDNVPKWDASAADSFVAQYDGNAGVVFIAEDGNDRVGVLAAQVSTSYYAPRAAACVATFFWVDSPFRRRGHGKALIDRMEEWARSRGASLAVLTAAHGEPSASVFAGAGYGFIESVYARRL